MTAILILGLFTAFQESGSPPVAADTGMIHGVLVDTKRGEVAFTAEVRHPKGKPCIDAWGQRVQAFVGTAVAGGKPAEFADHFVFLAEVDVNDIYKGLVELGLQTEKHVSRAEGRRVAGRDFLKGDPVAVFITWKEGDRWVEKPYEAFVREKVTVGGKEVIKPWTPHWVFHGSGVLHNERTGCIACPCDCPGGIIADNRNPIFEPKPTVFFDLAEAPPKGSKVIVRIRPRSGSKGT